MNYKNKEIKLSQDEGSGWLEWRKGGIGGSDVSIIMGSKPFDWGDTLDLWKAKAGIYEKPFEMTEAVQRGKDLEPTALKRYIEITGRKMSNTCYQLTEFPFVKASLDGINKKEKHIVEIKCTGSGSWYTAKKGIVAPYYYSQIQWQLLASNALAADYFVYREKEGGVLISVPRNEAYIEEMLRRSAIFWEMVESRTPCLPKHLGIDPYLDSDPFVINDNPVELTGVYQN